MPVAPRNRLNTAFPVRLMYVLPTIYPRKVENSIYKDKLEFVLQQYDFVFVLSLNRALAIGIIPIVCHEAVVIGGKEAVPLATYEVARSNSIMSVTHQKFRIHILGLMSCN